MILVTGGAGFIGSAMVWKLNQVGYTDIIIADSLGTSEKWKNLVGLRFADYLDKDDCLHKLLAEKFPRLDAIIHMGAISTTTEKNLDVLLRSNYEYTKELAAFAVQRSIRFIYASSAATYGDGSQGYDDDESKLHTLRPLNGYGYSKHLFDLWAQRKNLLSKIVGLKFFNVFGPNEYHKDDMASVVFKAYNQILQHGYVKLFKSHHPNYADGEQMRDFVYVKDCVEVMFWLLQNAHVNGILNLGTGKARTFKDLVTATFNAMGKPVQIEYIPMPEVLQDKYQYFTQAQMRKLYAAGCPVRFKSLEESVSDYVKQHLEKSIPYLRAAD